VAEIKNCNNITLSVFRSHNTGKAHYLKLPRYTYSLHLHVITGYMATVLQHPVVGCGLRGGDEHEPKEKHAAAVMSYVISSPLYHNMNAKDRTNQYSTLGD
jgi:hypothetical protein